MFNLVIFTERIVLFPKFAIHSKTIIANTNTIHNILNIYIDTIHVGSVHYSFHYEYVSKLTVTSDGNSHGVKRK